MNILRRNVQNKRAMKDIKMGTQNSFSWDKTNRKDPSLSGNLFYNLHKEKRSVV